MTEMLFYLMTMNIDQYERILRPSQTQEKTKKIDG